MIYFTPEFAIALLLFLLLYWGIFKFYGQKAQNFAILAFNYLVLCWINPYFALVVGIYTIVIYLMGILLYEYNHKFLLVLCLALSILNLSFFKYFSSIKDSFDMLLNSLGFHAFDINIILPLGISFYTFTSITYLCAVYHTRKCEDLWSVATFLSFFPTFIAGPIMRSEFFFAQLHKQRFFGNPNLICVLILFGIAKKCVFAAYLQTYSDPILQNPTDYNIMSLLFGIYAYSVRLYCDFSGYVDLVCAFALMLGFKLPMNFNMPYMARNIKDFWARWHISLSHFIRDYIYIPLGGNKKGFFLTQVFVLISFALSGIWHGNTLNYLIWGLWHGFGIIIFNICRSLGLKISIPYVSSILTFHFVAFGWILFCGASIDSWLYIQSFYLNITKPIEEIQILYFILCCLLFLCYPLLENLHKKCAYCLGLVPYILKPFVVSFFLIFIIGFSPNGIPDFIYAGF